jgi:AraC-like DNA-binding protein
MNTLNLPDIFFQTDHEVLPELNIFNYEVSNSSNKNKINMSKHVLSFLTEGQKQVHFKDQSVSINAGQSLLITSGNFLMTEHIGKTYFRCLLFFFPKNYIDEFFLKYPHLVPEIKPNVKSGTVPYFLLEKDEFITHFTNALAHISYLKQPFSQSILKLKFEEMMLYLSYTYKDAFLNYLKALLVDERDLSFKTIIENNIDTNLTLEEMAFLCAMSLSSFKRKFAQTYQTSPGKWFHRMRLKNARKLLSGNKVKPSEIFMDFGYDSLSNFSTAFKKEFGYSPKQVHLF